MAGLERNPNMDKANVVSTILTRAQRTGSPCSKNRLHYKRHTHIQHICNAMHVLYSQLDYCQVLYHTDFFVLLAVPPWEIDIQFALFGTAT